MGKAIRAVLFDLDNTLLETNCEGALAESRVFSDRAENRIPYDPAKGVHSGIINVIAPEEHTQIQGRGYFG